MVASLMEAADADADVARAKTVDVDAIRELDVIANLARDVGVAVHYQP